MRPCKKCGGGISVSGDGDGTYVAACTDCEVVFARGTSPGLVRETWNSVHSPCLFGEGPYSAAEITKKLSAQWADAEKPPKHKVVRREHRIDDRHYLVFEAKERLGSTCRWVSECSLWAKESGVEDVCLMRSNRRFNRTADQLANLERDWFERFRSMGSE